MASRPPDQGATVQDDLARRRWLTMQAMRAVGFGMVLFGILLTRDAVDIAGESNHLLGYFLIAIGLVDGFVMPIILARKWRTPRQ